MRKAILSVVLGIGSLITIAPSGAMANGSIVNGSFETGDFSGWDLNIPGLSYIETSYQSYGPDFKATDGNDFALLSAGGGANVYTTLSQTFTPNAGEALSFDIFFQANDYLPYNDNGYANLYDVTTNSLVTQLFYSSVGSVGNFVNTPWTKESYTFSNTDMYEIQAGVANELDNNLSSVLGVDDFTLGTPSSTPLPSAVSSGFLLFGVLGLVKLGRRMVGAAHC